MTQAPIFNRKLYHAHRNRAASLFPHHSALIDELSARILEKIDDELHRAFDRVLVLGTYHDSLITALQAHPRLSEVIACDVSENMLAYTNHSAVCADECALPFAPETFDLIISMFSLHWVNDIPSFLKQVHGLLKDGGAFLACFPGEETLTELRDSVTYAEAEIHGGISPRISPFIQVKDAGRLLQHAGFTLPVSDVDRITLLYSDVTKLMHDLRGMGETNALMERSQKPFTRELLATIQAHYQHGYATEEGLLPATFDIINLTGWKN